MSDNILEFPGRETEAPLEILIGPFTVNYVVVDGYKIPGLTGFKDGPNHTALIVDGRWSATFPNDLAYQAAWLIAQATAVAQGYSNMKATSKDMPFAPQVSEISFVP
jgi:hypothetical protein